MKNQGHKIHLSLSLLLLWFFSLWGTATATIPVPGKAGDSPSLDIVKAPSLATIWGEEELSRTFSGSEIKLLSSGIPVPQSTFTDPDCHSANLGHPYHIEVTDLRSRIEQLLFPFHFFY